MGKRLSIKVLDLLAVGCAIRQRIQHLPADDQYPAADIHTLVVVFPKDRMVGDLVTPVIDFDTEGHLFDFEFGGQNLVAACDYNDWGSARERLDPILTHLRINHEVF